MFHAGTEHPQEQHVAGKMQSATMDEHGRENGGPSGHRRRNVGAADVKLVVATLCQFRRDETPLVEKDAYVETSAPSENSQTTGLKFVEENEAVQGYQANGN
jgi:hypothetical protein